MTNAEDAEGFKDAGNKALQSGNATAAIENYTKAINADGTNHVYYSNRSAAYLKNGDGNNALEDAVSTIAINPGFSKGYSRKGGEFYRFKSSSFFAHREVGFLGNWNLRISLKNVTAFRTFSPQPRSTR